MNIEFRDRGMKIRELTRIHTRRRLDGALGRYRGEVGSVVVRFQDLQGPRGATDRCCAIQVAGPRVGTLVIEATDESLVAAIDHAVERVGGAMRRALERTRDAAMRGCQKALGAGMP